MLPGSRPPGLRALPRVAHIGSELFADRHPLLDRLFVDDAGSPVRAEVAGVVAAHRGHLDAAARLIEAHCPDLAADIAATTRRVLMYRATAPYSFATLSAHGAVFLNVPPDATEVFFLEDLAHQCAHVMFNAMTHDKACFLRVDPATPMRGITGEPHDARQLYSAFHALFTYTLICRVLSEVRDSGVLSARHDREALGRLGFTLGKFASDLARLDRPELFTPAGRLMHRRYAAACDAHMSRHGAAIAQLDLSDQPYTFDYARFARRNGRQALEEVLVS